MDALNVNEGWAKLVGRKQIIVVLGMWFAKDLEGQSQIVVAALAVIGAVIQGVLDWRQSRKESP
jgi:hypothetical protein